MRKLDVEPLVGAGACPCVEIPTFDLEGAGSGAGPDSGSGSGSGSGDGIYVMTNLCVRTDPDGTTHNVIQRRRIRATALSDNECIDDPVNCCMDDSGGGPGSGSGSGDGDGDGTGGFGEYCKLAGLETADCIEATGPANTVYLESAGGGVWASTKTLKYFDKEGIVQFWFEGGSLHLSIDGELLNCGNGCFKGGPLTGHVPTDPNYGGRNPPSGVLGGSGGSGGTGACSGLTFEVCVKCHCCPIEGFGGPGWYCIKGLPDPGGPVPGGQICGDCTGISNTLYLVANFGGACGCLNESLPATLTYEGGSNGRWIGTTSESSCTGGSNNQWWLQCVGGQLQLRTATWTCYRQTGITMTMVTCEPLHLHCEFTNTPYGGCTECVAGPVVIDIYERIPGSESPSGSGSGSGSGGGCVLVYLDDDDSCNEEIEVCSGPYATYAEGLTHCGPAAPVAPPTPINSPCCSGIPIPSVLNGVVSGATGTCGCMAANITFTYNSTTSQWISDTVGCGQVPDDWRLACNGTTLDQFRFFSTTLNCGTFVAPQPGATCSAPFKVVYNLTCTFGCTGTAVLTVTG